VSEPTSVALDDEGLVASALAELEAKSYALPGEMGPLCRVAAAKGVEKLIAIDLSGPNDKRSFGIFLAVPGENADILRPELVREFDVFRVREGL